MTRRILPIFLFVAVALSPAVAGPVFAPGTTLFTIVTEHFDIIFSERSRPIALRLSTMATYMHIVLIDSATDLSFTSFRGNYRNVFLHELTHAISLQIKAPWASFLS